jgi:hypothetical protein
MFRNLILKILNYKYLLIKKNLNLKKQSNKKNQKRTYVSYLCVISPN